MADRYRNYEELSADMQIDLDYRVRKEDRDTSVVILAPHGGTIEAGTSQIAQAIAAEQFSFYSFEAVNAGAHSDLHITSHRFDEPDALYLVGRSYTAVAIHGRKDDGSDTVWLGGRAIALRDAIGASLRDAGFSAEPNMTLPGVHETNICNRTRSGEGVQLELPLSLRRKLMKEGDVMTDFCAAVRTAIRSSSID